MTLNVEPSAVNLAATVSVTVTAPTLSIAPSSPPDGVAGQSYFQSLGYSLGGPLNRFWVASGSLPTGLTLTDGGVLSGTPTQHGTSSFTVIAQDIYGATGTRNYDLVVAIAPPVTGNVNATVTANSNSIALSLSGGTANSVAVTGAASHGTATASGTSITYTPTPGYSGSDSLTYTATNASGTSTAATVTITVTASDAFA